MVINTTEQDISNIIKQQAVYGILYVIYELTDINGNWWINSNIWIKGVNKMIIFFVFFLNVYINVIK